MFTYILAEFPPTAGGTSRRVRTIGNRVLIHGHRTAHDYTNRSLVVRSAEGRIVRYPVIIPMPPIIHGRYA